MNKNIAVSANQENAEAICARIDQDAADEARKILERAQAQAQQIVALAKEGSAANAEAARRRVDQEIEKDRDRLLSTLNLEKKRLALNGKQAFVEKVLAEVKACAGRWRQDRGYEAFLIEAVVEGIRVLDVPQVTVYYAAADAHLFTDEFARALHARCSAVVHHPCEVAFDKSDFNDLGVIIHSRDGRMMYDNRFSARLDRMYDDMYMELLKEAS